MDLLHTLNRRLMIVVVLQDDPHRVRCAEKVAVEDMQDTLGPVDQNNL